MANRRTLGDAMTLSSDKLAFIQGSTAKSAAVVNTPMKPDSSTSRPPAPQEPEQQTAPDALETPTPSARSTTRRSRSRGRIEEVNDPILLGMSKRWVPLTTKLQPSTAAALKRAGLEQRLRGENPATVQEIVEIAVADWLEKHDYL